MTNPEIKSYARGCLGRTAISLALSAGVFVVLGALMAGLALIPERVLPRDVKPFVLVGGLVCGGLVFGGAALGWVLVNNQRVYRRFDAAFLPLGLTRRRYLLSGFQYEGQYRGRPVNVYYHVSGGRYLRTPDLQLYVAGQFRTRLALGTSTALTRLGGAVLRQPPLAVTDPAYTGLLIYPLEEAWSRALLADPAARAAIGSLAGAETPGVRGLAVTPEAVRLHVRHFHLELITPETVRAWLEALTALAQAVEAQPAPAQPVAATQWERAERNDRGRFTLPALIIVGGLLCGVLALTGLALALTGVFQ